VLSVVIAGTVIAAGVSQELVIADNGRTDFVIVVAADASPSERHAATELQAFLEEICNARPDVRDDSVPMAPHEIILGDNAHLRQLSVKIDFAKLGDEGFTIRTVPPHLIIAGGRLRGTMYGVYTFLEDYLGCHWLAPDCSVIPKMQRVAVRDINDTQVPALEYREPFYKDAFDADWCARNKMNSSSSRLDEARGGKVTYHGFVHTFNSLLPPEKYFAEHPEYFSMVNGRRISDHTQLCCTNADVQRLVAEEVKRRMREHPEATVFSVSQNDWHNYCQCEECTKVAEREGSQIGPILELVNYVADQVRDEFPDKIIDTLAYQYSRKPPKHIRPRPNVVVRLCSIECCFSHPLATCDAENNARFREDIEGWSKVCDRLWVWDYVVDFPHYLLPFPNLRVLKPNIQFFVRNNVKGIFEEGDYNTVNGEFAKLRSYMMAKFLWNPDYPYEKALTEFLNGYYGPAATPIRQYIDLLHDKVERDNIHVMIWANPAAAYLTDEILARGNELFDEAERLVSSDPVLLERVQIARLPLYYVALERYKPKNGRLFALEGDFFRAAPDPDLEDLWNKFTKIAAAAQLTHVGEGDGRSLRVYVEGKEPTISGYRLVSLETRDLRAQIAPGLGGRVLALTHVPSGRQLCYLGSLADIGYPASGGYAGWWRSNTQGPGAAAAFQIKADEAANAVTLTTELARDIVLTRSVKARDPALLVITDTIANNTTAPQTRAYWTELRLACDPAKVAAVIGEQTRPLVGDADMPVAGLALTPEQASAGLRVLLGDGLALVWRVSSDALMGAGISLDPSRNMLALSARTGGEIAAKGTAQITWEIELAAFPGALSPVPVTSGLVVSQENEWGLYKEPDFARIDFDPTATNGFAAWMGGHHYEWAVQWRYPIARFREGKAYDVFARVKVAPAEGKTTGQAFTAGVYDTVNKTGLGAIGPNLEQIQPNQWQVWKLATVRPADGQYVWLAPTNQLGNIQALWVDCIWLLPAAQEAQ
jgi:hypothetical protein